MDARLAAALVAGKTATVLSRRLGVGGGTTFPGTIARKVDPLALVKLSRALPHGSIVVSGTNGKTTTSRLIASILRKAGLAPVHNRSGANLLGGVTAALVGTTGVRGSPRANIGLFEVDEAVMPAVVKETRPRVVLLTNLFRDQLDRYGEVDYLARLWRAGLAELDEDATVVLNADDPLVASLGDGLKARKLYYGLEDERLGSPTLPHAADSKNCLKCGTRLEYSIVYYGHIGKYRCPHCGAARPEPAVRATSVTQRGTDGSDLTVQLPSGEVSLSNTMPGLYNLYNTLAAVATSTALGIDPAFAREAVNTFSAAFGRIERVAVDGKQVFLALVKNPVGFGEVLRTILAGDDAKNLFILINDKFADGTDISWLWDVDFELIRGKASFVVVSGIRAEDMAVRLKYAQLPPDQVFLEKDPRAALEMSLSMTPAGSTLYVLPTYTAMLEVREIMRKLGYVGRFWED
ncbi:MAG: MurT ligase domain-containing protein [Chloroflexota bacterium]